MRAPGIGIYTSNNQPTQRRLSMKQLVTILAVLLATVRSDTFGWGNATHTYFADELRRARGGSNMHEMYGSVLVDAFNLMLDSTGVFMGDQTHHNYSAMVDMAWGCDLKAVAYGFTTHNDTWGADFTAHHAARTITGGGYAVVKGAELAPLLVPDIVAILVAAGVPQADAEYIAGALAPEFGHDLVETAVDLLIKRNEDPAIGRKIAFAALTRPGNVPLLLATAYARQLSQYAHISTLKATRYIVNAEKDNQQQMIQYGNIFMLSEPEAIQALGVMNAQIAQAYLEFYAGVPVKVDPATAVQFITSALSLVGPTYAAELSATLDYVRHELQVRRIHSCGPNISKESADEIQPPTPASEFGLSGNYPNPFNPTTTISYKLPISSQVTIRVYDVLGREVSTLVNEVKEPGTYTVQWNAGPVASGIYFCQLTAGNLVSTRKMFVLK